MTGGNQSKEEDVIEVRNGRKIRLPGQRPVYLSEVVSGVKLFVFHHALRMVEDSSSGKITYECHFCIHASKINDNKPPYIVKKKPFWRDFVEHLLKCDHFRNDGIMTKTILRNALNADKEKVDYATLVGRRSMASPDFGQDRSVRQFSAYGRESIVTPPVFGVSSTGRAYDSVEDEIIICATELYATGVLPRRAFSLVEMERFVRAAAKLPQAARYPLSDAAIKRTLDNEVERIHQNAIMTAKRYPGSMSLLCDSWDAGGSKKVLGFVVLKNEKLLNRILRIEDESGFNTARVIADIICENEKLLEEKFTVLVTDDAGNNARARKILRARFPYIIILKCYAHQFNLISKDVVKTLYPKFERQLRKFLHIFEQKTLRQKFQAYLKKTCGIETSYQFKKFYDIRWTSMYNTCTSIYNVSSHLVAFLVYDENREIYLNAVNKTASGKELFGTDEKENCKQKLEDFLDKANHISWLLYAVAIASKYLQNNENTLADIVFMLLTVYNRFDKEGDSEKRLKLLEILEKRWVKMDQPLFIAGLLVDIRFSILVKTMSNFLGQEAKKLKQQGISVQNNTYQFTWEKWNWDKNKLEYESETLSELACWACIFYRSKTLQMKQSNWSLEVDLANIHTQHFNRSFALSQCNPVSQPVAYIKKLNGEQNMSDLFSPLRIALQLMTMLVHTAEQEREFSSLAYLKNERQGNMKLETLDKLNQLRANILKNTFTDTSKERKTLIQRKRLHLNDTSTAAPNVDSPDSVHRHRDPQITSVPFDSYTGNELSLLNLTNAVPLNYDIHRGSLTNQQQNQQEQEENVLESGISSLPYGYEKKNTEDEIDTEPVLTETENTAAFSEENYLNQTRAKKGKGSSGGRLYGRDEVGNLFVLPRKREMNIRNYNHYVDKLDSGEALRSKYEMIDDKHPQEWEKDYPYLLNQAPRGAKIPLRSLFEAWVYALDYHTDQCTEENFLPSILKQKMPYVKQRTASQTHAQEDETESENFSEEPYGPNSIRYEDVQSLCNFSTKNGTEMMLYGTSEDRNDIDAEPDSNKERADAGFQTDKNVRVTLTPPEKVQPRRSGRRRRIPARFREQEEHYTPRKPIKRKKRT